jgi:hypothetical protein
MTRGKLDCHHRLFASSGGPDELENRIMLHGFGNNLRDADGDVMCHGYAHTSTGDVFANGWSISQYDRRPPQQVPVRHWQLGMVYLSRDGRVTPADLVVAWSADGENPLTEGDLARIGDDHG